MAQTTFKSFSPKKKYSKHSHYKGREKETAGWTNAPKRLLIELCSNCGFPWAEHWGDRCPTPQEVYEDGTPKSLKPVKH